MPPRPLKILGAPGSPYSRKLRSVLRYRRIPHVWIQRNSRDDRDTPGVPVQLIPVLVFPGADGAPDTAAIDSTPLIRRLESDYPERSVIPTDPAMAFVDALLEDYADEWLTKCMFHYRWYYEADATKARRVLPHWSRIDATDVEIAPIQKMIGERQIERLRVVGSNDVTAEVIEASYRRFLRVFDAHLQGSPFLFGRRPASSDFGLYGQLTCLALFDPTPAAVTLEESARVCAWSELLEDLSGKEPTDDDWTPVEALPDTLRAILGEVGRFHAPFLLANAEALERGADQVETEIAGKPWIQQPFPYQKKCLGWLRESHAALDTPSRATVDRVLEGSGCEALFE